MHVAVGALDSLDRDKQAVRLPDSDLELLIRIRLSDIHFQFHHIQWDAVGQGGHGIDPAVEQSQGIVAAVCVVALVVQLRFVRTRHRHVGMHELPALGFDACFGRCARRIAVEALRVRQSRDVRACLGGDAG